MDIEKLSNEEKFEKLRNYVAIDAATAHYPVPAEWVDWLLPKYTELDRSFRPSLVRKNVPKPFAEMCAGEKMTMIYREVEGANTSGLPTRTVPASWVVWLLAEYDRLVATSS